MGNLVWASVGVTVGDSLVWVGEAVAVGEELGLWVGVTLTVGAGVFCDLSPK